MAGAYVESEFIDRIRIGGFDVNRLGFGAMRITGPGIWGEPEDVGKAIRLLKRTVELGVDFIDTADAYGPNVSEELIAQALFPYRGVVITTKGGMVRSGAGMWQRDCSPKHLREACEGSLIRLKVDTIDLYQMHSVDPLIPFEDSFNTLLDLQREGKIRRIGLSNIEPEHFHKAINMGRFVSVQNSYNLFNRQHEDILRMCENHGVAFIPYFPLGGDRLNGVDNALIRSIATKHQATISQVALAWLLAHSPSILPIPGTSSINHLEENVGSLDIRLDDEDLEQLNNLSARTT